MRAFNKLLIKIYSFGKLFSNWKKHY